MLARKRHPNRHQKATTIQLNKNHTISREMTGTWREIENNTAQITLASKKSNGVFVRQW
ncbi:lipocalin-like domain-containing protein [Bacillus tequilensis]|uniref:lipocalin-like domain-containing protein n=1 Tax=Bacillus tequilensis TaxID=227866 RepID=UPI00285284CD|nr:glycoside hydrolase family 43 C-terminal domain-containing protein [Bacillus tequilensis]